MMGRVKVTFIYEPDEPDEEDQTGVSSAEFERVNDLLSMSVGAEDIQFEKAD